MNEDDQELLKRLFFSVRVLSLATVIEGEPYVGLLPFAVATGDAALLIHASDLARHTRGLTEGAPFSALLHQPDRPDRDPLQIPRATFSGQVTRLDKSSPAYTQGRGEYLSRFPDSAMTFQLADFNLYRLTVDKVRFVAGFGRAYNITLDRLQDIISA